MPEITEYIRAPYNEKFVEKVMRKATAPILIV